IRIVLKRESILENNIVQTIGSAGEAVAAGAIFTLPSLFMWANETGAAPPSYIEITLITLIGGVLGVLIMVPPCRRALIVQEHGTLQYPEGQACADVLMAGEEGGAKASIVFWGLGISVVYKFISGGLKLFSDQVDYGIKAYPGAGIGMDVIPSLLGVGYICGPQIASYLFAGGMVAWLVLMPLIVLVGGNGVLAPSDIPISTIFETQGTWGIWSTYIRYIGAGALATGCIISLMKNLPLMIKTFSTAFKKIGVEYGGSNRLDEDLPNNLSF
ncbi:OPT/YSL family transporter, partial [Eubacterium aggregans]|uniref:OPT/YSL family transporter n=1 Tax=Eubacterium aggregans TaxID=81409 RepID=UPI003F37817B